MEVLAGQSVTPFFCLVFLVTICDFLFQVGPSGDKRSIKCLCNHLTAFGGNFIQAPNPIDFDKVFVEFTRLGESGNIAVLVTIAVLFLLYFVLIAFARRADKRDENAVKCS